MELEKKILHKTRELGKALSQVTLDDDYNLPDYKPDLTKVICEKGQLHFEETHISSGHIWIKGVLVFHILYRTDLDGKKLNELKGEIPFQESLVMEGIEEFDPVRAEGKIEDISVSVINSRKLSIRSLVEFRAEAQATEEAEVLTGLLEEEKFETEKENMEALELVLDQKDTLRIRKELSLSSNKPNIEEILWSSVQLRGMNCRPRTGEIEVQGEAIIYLLYSGVDEDGRLQWFETTVPLKGSVECASCEENQICYIQTEAAQTDLESRPDEDGEERNLLLELVLNLKIMLWREENLERISDIYALDRELQPELQTMEFEKLLIKNDTKCRIADKIELEEEKEDILQICVNEETLEIEQAQVTADGVLAEGVVVVEILYMTADEAMPIASKRAYLPFRQLIEMPQAEGEVRLKISGGIDQATTVLTDSRTIDVKAVLSLELVAFERQKREMITDIKEAELDLQALQQRAGIVGYIVRDGDRLFQIAKENHTTVEELAETNHLSGGQIKAGEKLLIVKKVG